MKKTIITIIITIILIITPVTALYQNICWSLTNGTTCINGTTGNNTLQGVYINWSYILNSEAGIGDITEVNTNGEYLTGGGTTGAISLLLNETKLNATITALSGSGDITSVTAGTGLLGGGTIGDITINVSSEICGAGDYSRYNGTGFECFTDDDGTDTTYNSDEIYINEITNVFYLNETKLNITITSLVESGDTNETTRMNNIVNNACSSGNFVYNFSQNGTPQCDAPAGSGDITAVYTNGKYLTGGSDSGDISILLNETELNTTITNLAGSSTDDQRLNEIGNPNASKTFAMGAYSLIYQFNNPTNDGMYIEATGGYTGELLHLSQNTGNPGATYMMLIEATDTDVEGLKINITNEEAIEIWGGSNIYMYENGQVMSSNWSNVTITESQISDLVHTIDTTIGNCSVQDSCTDIMYIEDLNTQGEAEALWGVTLALDSELADQDECAEITNCVSNAWDSQDDILADGLAESKIDFDTVCGAGNHLYVSGNDLACEADDYNSDFDTEDEIEAVIFDNDNTANLDMNGYNITTTYILMEQDQTNHKIYDNATCIIITGDTSTLQIC